MRVLKYRLYGLYQRLQTYLPECLGIESLKKQQGMSAWLDPSVPWVLHTFCPDFSAFNLLLPAASAGEILVHDLEATWPQMCFC